MAPLEPDIYLRGKACIQVLRSHKSGRARGSRTRGTYQGVHATQLYYESGLRSVSQSGRNTHLRALRWDVEFETRG